MRELRESREAVNTSCERAAAFSRLVFVASREEEKARKTSGTGVVGGGKDGMIVVFLISARRHPISPVFREMESLTCNRQSKTKFSLFQGHR